MKLTKQQINAIALKFIEPINEVHRKEEKRRDKAQRYAWDKTPDGKLFAKLPQWMKDAIGEYRIQCRDEYCVLRDKSPMPKRLEYGAVANEIIIATIGAVSVADITSHLKDKFDK